MRKHTAQKYRTTNRVTGKIEHELFRFAEHGATNAPRKGEGTQQQNDRVDRSHLGIQELRSVLEDFWVVVAVERVSHEQRAKEQNFREQEDPDAKLARIELLTKCLEVMCEMLGASPGSIATLTLPPRGGALSCLAASTLMPSSVAVSRRALSPGSKDSSVYRPTIAPPTASVSDVPVSAWTP